MYDCINLYVGFFIVVSIVAFVYKFFDWWFGDGSNSLVHCFVRRWGDLWAGLVLVYGNLVY